MTRYRKRLATCMIALATALTPLAGAHAQAVGTERILAPARSAYYSLGRLGFAGAECRIVPTWEVTLGTQRNSDNAAGFAILDQLEVALKVDASGSAHVTVRDPGGPRAGTVQTGIEQLSNGFEQAMNGMFATWSLFMVNSPLPGGQMPVTLTDAPGGGHRLAYKDGTADIVEDLDAQGVIGKVDVRSPSFTSTIQPAFEHSPRGLILSRYLGDYQPASGPGAVKLDVRLTYQTVDGLTFPSQAGMDTTLDGAPSKMQLTFADCRVARK